MLVLYVALLLAFGYGLIQLEKILPKLFKKAKLNISYNITPKGGDYQLPEVRLLRIEILAPRKSTVIFKNLLPLNSLYTNTVLIIPAGCFAKYIFDASRFT